MSEHDYLLVWYVYLGAAALGYLAGWQLTGWMWRGLREPIRLLALIILFVPTLVDAEHGRYAPAIIVVALDLLFNAGTSWWKALLDMAGIAMFAVPLWLISLWLRWQFIWRKADRKARARAEAAAASEAVRRESEMQADYGFSEKTFAEILQDLPKQGGAGAAPRS